MATASDPFEDWKAQYRMAFYDQFGFQVPDRVPQSNDTRRPEDGPDLQRMSRWTEYEYDEAGNRLVSRTVNGDGSGLLRYDMTYDEAGNRLTRTEYTGDDDSPSILYAYDYVCWPWEQQHQAGICVDDINHYDWDVPTLSGEL